MSRKVQAIGLRNFKTFPQLTLPLGQLTVLTGTNSSGKSSVMQALALLEQSREGNGAGLVLNGPLVELGTFADSLYDRINEQSKDSESIGIDVRGARWLRYQGGAPFDSDYVPLGRGQSLSDLPWKHLTYVRADRLGPTVLQDRSHTSVVSGRSLGPRGEYSAHFLSEYRDTEVHRAMQLRDASPTLEAQTEAWLHLVSPDTQVHLGNVAEAGAMWLQFSDGALTGLSSGRMHRSTNVGFGLSYVLPILVACLMSRAGDVVMIENPEAHLHPRAQTALGTLCALASKAGAQVLLETHSDHVLNAIRLAVADTVIDTQSVRVHFFFRAAAADGTSIQELTIDRKGRIDYWPKGFFDEYTSSLLRLSDY